MQTFRPLASLLLSFSLLACAATSDLPKTAAPAQSVQRTPIPLDPAVRQGKLDNGLTYYLRSNRRPEKRAALRLVVNAGSVLEDDDQRGLAHFVEHMAFNGTKRFEKQALVNYLERIGMRFGPDVNAYTSFDETVYMLEIPTDDPKIMETAFQILEDWAQAVSFEPQEVEKERGVVIEEWRLGRGAGGRIRDKQFPVMFHGSRYADRLPIGAKEVLETASRDTLVRYYKQWYRPDLMAVVAVGDFDAAAVAELVKKHFGSIPAPASEAKRTEFPIPDHQQTLVSIVTDPETTGSEVRVLYKRPRMADETVEDFRERLVDRLYDAMMINRLRELTTKADPPFQFGFAASGSLGRTKSSYTLAARVLDGGVERGLAALLTEARRVEKHGFLATELDRAKVEVLRQIERQWEEREKQESARHAARLTAHFLDDNPAPSIDFLRDLYGKLVPGISLAEVNARAGQWLTTTNRVILVSGPKKESARIPDEKAVLGVFEAADQVAVTPWIDQVKNEPLVARPPAAGSVVEESLIPELGVTRWKLSNGATVLLKPTDFKNDEVLLRGHSFGGHSLVSDTDFLTATQASAIVNEMGAGNFNQIELQKALTGKVASARTGIGEYTENVSASASPKDLATMMQLVYLRLTGARRDEEAFKAYLSRMRGFLENQQAAPGYHFSRRFSEVFSKNHPRRRFLEVEDLAKIDLDRAIAIYRDRFADGSDYTFTIVGNFTLDQIRPLVTQWLGGLPSIQRRETWRDVGIREPAGVVKFDVRKGIEPKSSVRITFHGDAKWSVMENHLLVSLAEVLRMRLREELREEKGGVYGVGVSGAVSRRPKEEYTFNVNFSCDPARVDELVAVLFSEIEKLKNSPSSDHVQRVREGQTRRREIDLKENGYWLNVLEYHVANGIDPREILKRDQLIAAVTDESMKTTARKYLNTGQYVMGVLYPEK
ncbi:MAG TPA: insulinase family protein [Thermoanaerobaculia bacterium]|nr:insulinase family protein [Thermoanaerobaculia bacterium]